MSDDWSAASTAGVVANDDPVKTRRARRSALTTLAHDRSIGAGPAAGALATDGVQAVGDAFLIKRAHDARIELGEFALTVNAARTAAAGVENRAISVHGAPARTTFTGATFVARETVDDRGDAKAIEAHVGNARVVVLAPAVAMILAAGDARPVGAPLSLGTTVWTRFLGCCPTAEARNGNRRHRRAEKTPTIACGREPTGEIVESSGIH